MLIYLIIRPNGPSAFILCSMIGLILSTSKGKKKDQLRENRKRILKRAFIFLVIGAILNTILTWNVLIDGEIAWFFKIFAIIFTWNIITFIGVAQLILYLIRKIKIRYQVVATIVVFVLYYLMIPVIIQECVRLNIDYKSSGIDIKQAETSLPLILYFLFFFENSMAPFMPWVAEIFMANIVFSRFAELYIEHDEDGIRHETRRIMYLSLAIMIVGMLLGSKLSKGEMSTIEYEILVGDGTVWNENWGGFPLFLQINTAPYLIFSFGLNAFLNAFVFKKMDLDGKKYPGMKTIMLLGKYSLTIFVFHAISFFIPLRVNLVLFLLALLVFTGLFIIGIHYWEVKLHGKGSLEWLIRVYLSNDVIKLIREKTVKKNGRKKSMNINPL